MSRDAAKDVTDEFMVEDAAPERGPQQHVAAGQQESDQHRLAQRQKQVDIGKNTLGYQRYCQAIPRSRRSKHKDPMTPDVYQVCSKRAFEGQVKKWRRQLHAWDPPEEGGEPAVLPVHSGRAAHNPPPPASERSDDFEHISHADADPSVPTAGAARPGSSAAPPKNGGLLRLRAASLPPKVPSAMRKRSFDETAGAGDIENLRPQHNAMAAPVPGGKLQRRSPEGGDAALTAAASAPGWADQRFQDPELDYGASDDDGDWQHVRPTGEGRLIGQYKTIYNNPAVDEWDEEDIQV